MTQNSGIYSIKNLINNKLYIGSSVNITRRWYDHIHKLKHNKHKSQYLQRSYNKYNKENFKFEVLAYCPPEYCIKLEQWFLDNMKPEYNTCKKAGNTLGFKHSEVTKEKFRLHHKKVQTKPPINKAVAVNQYNLDGTFVKTYERIIYAAEATNCKTWGIVKNCKNVIKTYNNFIWKYTNK